MNFAGPYLLDEDGDVVIAPLACDPRAPVRDVIPSRPSDRMLQSMVNVGMINTLFSPSSNPASPGPSSPPLEQPKDSDIVPPTRPSSTPFPHLERRNSTILSLTSPGGLGTHDFSLTAGAALPGLEPAPAGHSINFNNLPPEIHECILDHLFGYRVSATSKSSLSMQSVTKSWATAMRHSRRKELSQLALVSPVWRVLVQDRLYRHIKLRATVPSLQGAMIFFQEHKHLRAYVKHVEMWFPVFQPKYGPLALGNTLALPTVTIDGLTNATYVLPHDNSTLEEAFRFVANTLPDAAILTLEGGERKKAPKVQNFSSPASAAMGCLPALPAVRTLVTRGQWNLMRGDDDFETVLCALPNLDEWHASYSKPKSKSYLSMASILPHLSDYLTSLHLCLEGDYRREPTCPAFYLKVWEKVHFCVRLAEASPMLEHLSYTGRVCRMFFDVLALHTDSRSTRLKTIDITVKNCCRSVLNFHDSGSGIHDMNFINAFELLVISAIRSLDQLKAMEYLRIRFVDLDSMCPPLNPYFVLKDGYCSGVWSDKILTELNEVRPDARWLELSESFGDICLNKDGRMVISPEYPRSRVLSLKLSNYSLLSGAIQIP